MKVKLTLTNESIIAKDVTDCIERVKAMGVFDKNIDVAAAAIAEFELNKIGHTMYPERIGDEVVI